MAHGMNGGVNVPVSKVTIAVNGDLLRDIDREAEARGMSRSQWMSYATTATLERDLLVRSIDKALEETGGPMTAAEEAEAKRKLSRLLKRQGRVQTSVTTRASDVPTDERKLRVRAARHTRRRAAEKGNRGAA